MGRQVPPDRLALLAKFDDDFSLFARFGRYSRDFQPPNRSADPNRGPVSLTGIVGIREPVPAGASRKI
jgi:hypothetical protein